MRSGVRARGGRGRNAPASLSLCLHLLSLSLSLSPRPHLQQGPGRGGRPHQGGQVGDGVVRDGGHWKKGGAEKKKPMGKEDARARGGEGGRLFTARSGGWRCAGQARGGRSERAAVRVERPEGRGWGVLCVGTNGEESGGDRHFRSPLADCHSRAQFAGRRAPCGHTRTPRPRTPLSLPDREREREREMIIFEA